MGRIGPRADGIDAPYWDGQRSAELRMQRCAERHTWWWFPVWRDDPDRGIQAFGGLGYSRRRSFEHIDRHHHRHRITEETEEMRGVGGYLFDVIKQQTPKSVMAGDWNAYPCWI
jgi:hypothetical protein